MVLDQQEYDALNLLEGKDLEDFIIKIFKENGYICKIHWIEGATCIGNDANIYLCRKDMYEREFGEISTELTDETIKEVLELSEDLGEGTENLSEEID